MRRSGMLAAVLSAALLLNACAGNQPGSSETGNPTDGQEFQQVEAVEQEQGLQLLTVMKEHKFLSEWEEEHLLCEAQWQELTLGEENRTALADSLSALNEACAADGTSYVECVLPMAAEAAQNKKFQGFTYTSGYSIQRADEHILSLRRDVEEYTGGDSSLFSISGINFDPETGERLSINDVLTSTGKLPALLAEKLREKYADVEFDDLEGKLAEYALGDYAWSMHYRGVTFYFKPHEIATPDAGLLNVTLWFDDTPELFRAEYMQTPERGWFMELPFGYEVEADLKSGDGVRDSLGVSRLQKKGTDAYSPVVTCNGQTLADEEYYAYWMDAYLVCLGRPGEERCSIWLIGSAENDYNTVRVYDLGGEEPSLRAVLPGTGLHTVWYEKEDGTYTAGIQALTDPEAFLLDTRLDMLGTMEGTMCYSADPTGGLPKAEQDSYDLPADRDPLISLLPLEVEILPESSVEEIPAGAEFTFLRTDGVSYVDMQLEDGRECRIAVEQGTWSLNINGISEWDCFANLMYAG